MATTSITTTIQAIIFRRTIRASYATLDLVYFNENEEIEEHVVAILQCPNDTNTNSNGNGDGDGDANNDCNIVSSWRSHIRRICKLGTEISLNGTWCNGNDNGNDNGNVTSDVNKCRAKRFRVEHEKEANCTNNDSDASDNANNHNDGSSRNIVRVTQMQRWDMIKCQVAREKFYPGFDHDNKNKNQNKNKKKIRNEQDGISTDVITEELLSLSQRKQKKYGGQTGHGGGLGKRKQGEIIADFLIDLVTRIHESENNGNDNCNKLSDQLSSTAISQDNAISSQDVKSRFVDLDKLKRISKDDDVDHKKRVNTIEYLNRGSGVMDVAGGSGHLSLALALRGITSTVIDPRETVGKLPGRDRKTLRKALKGKERHGDDEIHEKTSQPTKILPPPIEFSSKRAWFATRPDGIDVEFREGRSPLDSAGSGGNDSELTSDIIPICTVCSPDGLLSSCSSIVALHPDEATGEIVDFAVKHRVPFIVVPCCVFSRLFPNRFKPQPVKLTDSGEGSDKEANLSVVNEIVSTYDDLIEYLVNKDPSIRITKMDFEGANLALWSMFKDN